MADPAIIGTAAGAAIAVVGAFYKIFRVEKSTKAQNSEILDALKIVKEIFQPPNGNGKGKDALKSDGIPGFAPECLLRAKEHGARLAVNESEIHGVQARIVSFDARFDGLNAKIENVRKDLKADIEEMKEDVSGKLDDLKREIRASS